MKNYENDRFYINEAMFKSVFPDLYNALNDLGLLETGTYTYYRNQTKYTKDVVAFIGSIQEVFITSYVNEVFGALKGMSEDHFSSITDSLAEDNTNIANFFYNLFNETDFSDEDKTKILMAYLFNEDYSMPLTNIAKK